MQFLHASASNEINSFSLILIEDSSLVHIPVMLTSGAGC